MEYEILESNTRFGLVNTVSLAIRNGWIPIGGVEVSHCGMFYQAVWREYETNLQFCNLCAASVGIASSFCVYVYQYWECTRMVDVKKLYVTKFALLPRRRVVRTEQGFVFEGYYWLRQVTLMNTIWNGWTAFAEDNDE